MTGFRRFLKKAFPGLVDAYKTLRDLREARLARPVPTPLGFLMCGNSSMIAGTFEPKETNYIAAALNDTDVFVDVGANVGYYSLLARKLGVYTIPIEPFPPNIEMLGRNFVANGWTDVELFPVGLSRQSELHTIYGGTTAASLIKGWEGSTDSYSRTIPLSTLDIVLGTRFNGKRLLIKVDVEGHDYPVLQGASRTLDLVPPPIWIVEVCLHHHHPSGMNPNFFSTFELFWAKGYSAYLIGSTQAICLADLTAWARNPDSVPDINFVFKKLQ